MSEKQEQPKPQSQNVAPSASKPTRQRRKKGMCLEDRLVLEPNAAGIDVGAREMFVAVPPGRDENPVRVFATFTEDLEQLADWLLHCGVTTVAMESTGVYWMPLYDILEQRGIRPCLVNARHMKNAPGRRTDWHECQWLQFLHSVGLLRPAFRPEDDICAVRTLLRHRNELLHAHLCDLSLRLLAGCFFWIEHYSLRLPTDLRAENGLVRSDKDLFLLLPVQAVLDLISTNRT